MKTRLEVVRLEDIVIFSNYRKTFDEAKIVELSKSVKEDGVLQPVLLRPIPDNGDGVWIDLTDPQAKLRDKLPRFYLVCGERRVRAAILAGLEDIPANIRELTDDQAFELQLIENLQRQDVHPLEEAEAYKQMLDTGRYSIPDVAAKMAKPEPFIQQRLKLNDLIPEIKQDFLHAELGIGHAVEIARLDIELQQGLYKNFKGSWRVTGWGTLKELKDEITKQFSDLSKAIFAFDELYSVGRACEGCTHRSLTNPLLFEDMQGDHCFNKACYATRSEDYIAQQAENAITGDEGIVLAMPSWNTLPESVKNVANKHKAPILNNFNESRKPDTVKQRVLFVAGNKAGQVHTVYVPKEIAESKAADRVDLVAQIEDIEKKAKRGLELDAEKIHTSIINALKGEFGRNKIPDFDLSNDMLQACMFWLVLYGMDYSQHNTLEKLGLPVKTDFPTVDDMVKAMQEMLPAHRRAIMVVLLFEKFKTSTGEHWMGGKLIRKMAEANQYIDTEKIEANQKAAAQKRIGREQERLAELRSKLEGAQEPKKESKKTTAKTK